MKINFTIYWFENDISFANSNNEKIEEIKKILNDYWFYPDIKFFFDSEPLTTHTYINNSDKVAYENIGWYDIENLQTSYINFNNADLVLMDYHLSDTKKWDEIIKYIRDNENDFFTDILFYSSQWNQSELRKMADRDWLYCESRSQLFDKFKKVIRTIIKKTQDLNSLRWLVMAESSEIDMVMREILLKLYSNHNLTTFHISLCSCGACSSCKKENREFQKDWTTIYKLRRKWTITNNIKWTISSELFEAIKSFLDSNINSTWYTSNSIDWYRTDTKRNLLAHYPEDSSSKTEIKIIDDDWVEHIFKEEDFNNIRKNIKKYKKIFEEIKSKI